MGALDDGQIALQSRSHDGDTGSISVSKEAMDQKTAIEISEHGHPDDAPKAHYSKLSIWLTILYSGLAIGSDG